MFFRLFIVLICLGLVSCLGDDSNKLSSESLQGTWEIFEAKRNGKITRLLKSGFIQFKGDSLLTNINSTADTMIRTFSISDKIISAQELQYNVLRNNIDTLVLSTKISHFSFELSLKKE